MIRSCVDPDYSPSLHLTLLSLWHRHLHSWWKAILHSHAVGVSVVASSTSSQVHVQLWCVETLLLADWAVLVGEQE